MLVFQSVSLHINILIMLRVQQALLLVTAFPYVAHHCFAQNNSTSGSSSPSDSTSASYAEGTTHTVIVGKVVQNNVLALRKGETS